jgi:hypothetical protein
MTPFYADGLASRELTCIDVIMYVMYRQAFLVCFVAHAARFDRPAAILYCVCVFFSPPVCCHRLSMACFGKLCLVSAVFRDWERQVFECRAMH